MLPMVRHSGPMMSTASWVASWLVSDHSHLTSEPSGPG
jgi:hypothetical protein